MSVTRRKFLGSSAAAVIVAGTMAKGKVFGANDRIQMCTIGFNGQGSSHIRDIVSRDLAQYVALCDVDSHVLDRGVRNVKKAQGSEPKTYRDIREALADDSIDAVTIATPNHWHTLAAMWALKAGKDVYVEKPAAWSVWEGRQLVAAAKKYGKILQHGTQSRTDATLIRDMKLIHEGFIGKVVHSRGYVYKNGNRYAIGHAEKAAPPEHLDWKLWQGPSPDHDFLLNADAKKKRGLQVHYNWHWFWEYGNGEIGNQGVHEMDIACWAHKRGMPIKISSTGGRFGWDDDGETPNTQATQFTYADGSMMTFEVRNLGSFEEARGGSCGNSVFGTDGYYVRRKGFFSYKDNKPIRVEVERPKEMHKFEYFCNAIRSGKQEDVPMSLDDMQFSCAHCHLGNVAYRVGHTLEFDPATETFTNDSDANALLTRVYRDGFKPEELA